MTRKLLIQQAVLVYDRAAMGYVFQVDCFNMAAAPKDPAYRPTWNRNPKLLYDGGAHAALRYAEGLAVSSASGS